MIKPSIETRFFIEKILYLIQTIRILRASKGTALYILSCFDYPFISSIDFPGHTLFSAFMLHGKALKIIPIHGSLYWPIRRNYRSGVLCYPASSIFFTNNKR